MVTGHVLLAGGTLHLAGEVGKTEGLGGWAASLMAGGEAAGSAINTPAPGRASAPPSPRGRISARKACCAGTQNTSHTVTALRGASTAPLDPTPMVRTLGEITLSHCSMWAFSKPGAQNIVGGPLRGQACFLFLLSLFFFFKLFTYFKLILIEV